MFTYDRSPAGAAMLLVATLSLSACVVTDPKELFNRCVSVATVGMEPNQTKEITCDLTSSTVVVALAPETPTMTELISKGLPERGARMVSKTGLGGSRWCFAELPEESHEPSVGGIVCVESQTPIEQLFVVRGRRIRVTLSRGQRESVSVVRIRATDDDATPDLR